MTDFIRLQRCLRNDTNTEIVLEFLRTNRTTYRFTLKGDAIRQTIDALQQPQQKTKELLTLTVRGHQALMNPNSKGLMLVTEEMGSIAFSIPQEKIAGLREALAKLETMPSTPPTKQ